MTPLVSALAVFVRFNEMKVCYCHWKSNEHLLEGLAGETDLDVLVDKQDQDKAATILLDCDYIKMTSQYGSEYPNVEDWLGFDRDTSKMIHIHLHYAVITGHTGMKEYDLPWTKKCLETKVMHPEFPVYVTNPDLEVVILATRIALKLTTNKMLKSFGKNYSLASDDKREFEYLRSRLNWGNVKEYLDAEYKDDAQKVFELLHTEAFDGAWIRELHCVVSRNSRSWSRVKFPLNYILRAYYSIIIPMRFGIKKYANANIATRKTFGADGGLLIAFVGQDGAGKSTITNDILQWFSWKSDAKRFYLGSGDHYRSIYKMVYEGLSEAKGYTAKLVRIVASLSNLKHLAKRSFKQLNSADKYRKMGGIALFDRYPQVQFYGINDGPKIRQILEGKKVNKLVRKYIQKAADIEEKYLEKAVAVPPDLVFKLILSPEESIHRKPEESLQVVRQKQAIINELKFPDSRVYVISAEQEYENEKKEILNIIWSELVRRREYNDTF